MPKARKLAGKPKAGKKITQKLLQQVAALPVRRTSSGALEVLLVTSRESRRWIIPKGWPMKGKKRPDAAAIEAQEEAGVAGHISRKPSGSYVYEKRLADGRAQRCRVTVYRLEVTHALDDWREAGQREVHWLSVEEAAERIQEPELIAMIRDLGAG